MPLSTVPSPVRARPDRLVLRLRARRVVAARLRSKAADAGRAGSSLYAGLLSAAADDVVAGGPCWRVLRGHQADPRGSALALRFMGAVHRLALEGRAPGLARHYPSCGGDAGAGGAAGAFLAAVERHVAELGELVHRPVQTNEVGRSAVLAGGFLTVAAETGLPLRILEVGASAGLNLRWDRYGYEGAGARWGDPSSPVTVPVQAEGRLWPPAATFSPGPILGPTIVAERAGCDPNPIDPADPEGRLTLLSFVWPDQTDRMALLRAALDLAVRVPARIDRAGAVPWLRERLAEPAPGMATVVAHSIVAQFLGARGRRDLRRLMTSAGRRAGPDAPLAWLRMESGRGLKDLELTMWPGGRTRLLARAGLYGRPVRWLDPTADAPDAAGEARA